MHPLYEHTGVCLDDYNFTPSEGQEGYSEALLCAIARPELEGVSYMWECPASVAGDGTVRYALPVQTQVDMLEQVTSGAELQNPRLVFLLWDGSVSVPFTPGEKLDLPLAALNVKVEVWTDAAQEVPSVRARCAVMYGDKRGRVRATGSWRGYPIVGNRLSDVSSRTSGAALEPRQQ